MIERETPAGEADQDASKETPDPVSRGTLRSSLIGVLPTSIVFWYFTTVLVLIGVSFGFEQVTLERLHGSSATRVDWLSSFAAWDGEWYVGIVDHSYTYDPQQMSSVAFFPAYPTLAGAVKWVTGCRTEIALLVISHLAMLGCFIVLAMYISERFASDPELERDYALLSLGLFPTTFWMRMCYTESLFLLSILLAMLAMQRRWHPLAIAVIIGFATATRSAGVALLPVFWWWLWIDRQPRSISRAMSTALTLLPVCLWGLLAYIFYLYWKFDAPFAFTQTQPHWNERLVAGLGDKLIKLVTLEPFWAVYVPSSACYWGKVPPQDNPLFNMKFWNPIYVLGTAALVGYGIKKRWVNAREILLVLGLLAIPLWFQATRTCMMSQARYASVIFPTYIVLGKILAQLPAPLTAVLCSASGLMLGVYTAMFVSWHWFY